MRQPLLSPLFISSSLLFVTHQVLQLVLNIPIPIADAYLDNLLTMPIILPLLTFEQVYVFKRKPGRQTKLLIALIATIYVSVISEWVFPALSNRFTYDAWDIVFIFMGAAIHLYLQATTRLR